MSKVDAYELEVLESFEKGKLKSIATKSELEKLKAAARATAIKNRRVNIRLSPIDLSDIQVKALEEGGQRRGGTDASRHGSSASRAETGPDAAAILVGITMNFEYIMF